MNFKSLFVMIVLLISLGVIVSSTELVFDDNKITISIKLINGSGLWNQTGDNIFPEDATNKLQIQSLVSCDTIDTDALGVFSCGTDDGSSGTNDTLWNISGTSIFLRNIGDSVGIGTSSPTKKLDVSGNTDISLTLNVSGNVSFTQLFPLLLLL